MICRYLGPLVLLLVTATAPAVASADAPQRLLATLQGYEWQLDRAALASLPADAWQGYMAIAADAGQAGFVRARAAASLVAYPNDSVWQFYLAAIAGDLPAGDGPGLNRRRSVESICAAFAAERPAALATVLLPLLEQTDVHLRIQAANCLQQLDVDSAHAALAAYRGNIAEDWERRATANGLQNNARAVTP